MKVEFEPIPRRYKRGVYGWLKIDGKRYTTIRKDKNGSLVVYLFSGTDWAIREGAPKRGTVTIICPPY